MIWIPECENQGSWAQQCCSTQTHFPLANNRSFFYKGFYLPSCWALQNVRKSQTIRHSAVKAQAISAWRKKLLGNLAYVKSKWIPQLYIYIEQISSPWSLCVVFSKYLHLYSKHSILPFHIPKKSLVRLLSKSTATFHRARPGPYIQQLKNQQFAWIEKTYWFFDFWLNLCIFVPFGFHWLPSLFPLCWLFSYSLISLCS